MKSIKLALSAMLFLFGTSVAWADASAPTSIIAEDSGTAPYFDSLEDCEQYRKLPGKKKTYVSTTLAKKEFPGGGEWKRYRPGPSGACFGGAKVWQNGKVVTKTVVMFAHESAKTDFWWNGSFGLMNFCNNFFSDLSGDYSPVTDEQGVVGADIMPPPAPVSCEGECERNRRKTYCDSQSLGFNPEGDDDKLGSCVSKKPVAVDDDRFGVLRPGKNIPPVCPNCIGRLPPSNIRRTDFSTCEPIRRQENHADIIGYICRNDSNEQGWRAEGEMCGASPAGHFTGFKIFCMNPQYFNMDKCNFVRANKLATLGVPNAPLR